MDIAGVLEQAIEAGEVLKVKYHGGSCPGGLREIAPIKLVGPKVRARCYTSDAVKVFMVAKLEIVDYQTKGESWHEIDKTAETSPDVLEEWFSKNRHIFEGLGWLVESDFSEDGCGINLFRAYKNGKKYKRCDVSIYFDPYCSETASESMSLVIGLSGDNPEVKSVTDKKVSVYERFWYVGSKQEDGRDYKFFSKAIARFTELSEKYAPNNTRLVDG